MTAKRRQSAPRNKKELFERLIEITQHGNYKMPIKRYSGTGAPGIFLEDLLGLTTGNKDIPDSLGWEIKYYTPRTALITLFHKEPQPLGIVREMVSKFGWKDAQGRLSFRHTISGKSENFRVNTSASRIVVRPLNKKGPITFWTHDELLSAAGAKLRRLVLVRGVQHKQEVRYDRIDCFENLQLTVFIDEVVKGTVRIDFDAREAKAGSKGLRNHGTKFRVPPDDVCRLYAKKERIC